MRLADRESVQLMLSSAARDIHIGRLLTMQAAWLIDEGGKAQKEVSMAKIHVADALHKASDTALQLLGAKGYSKDTVVEWIY
jgi:acyl-CoA dehydrogenase